MLEAIKLHHRQIANDTSEKMGAKMCNVNKNCSLKAKDRTKDSRLKAKARTKDQTFKAKARTKD